MSNHPEMVATIAIHAWWPGAGDPFYTANVDENRARITYYSVNYTPHTYFDGIDARVPGPRVAAGGAA